MVNRGEAKFRKLKFGHIIKSGKNSVTTDKELNLLLTGQADRQTSNTKVASKFSLSQFPVHIHDFLMVEMNFVSKCNQLCNGDDNFVKRIIFFDKNNHVS